MLAHTTSHARRSPNCMTDPTPPASGAPWLPDRASFEGALGSHLVRRPGQSAVFVLELKDLADIAGTYGVAMAAAISTVPRSTPPPPKAGSTCRMAG